MTREQVFNRIDWEHFHKFHARSMCEEVGRFDGELFWRWIYEHSYMIKLNDNKTN